MSLSTVTYQGFSPFGGLLIGAVAGTIGTTEAVGLSAAACAAAALIAMAAVPVIRTYNAPEAAPQAATATRSEGWLPAGASVPAGPLQVP